MTTAAEALGVASELAEARPEDLINRLQRHVWLVSLTIGWPKFSYQIGDAVVEIKTGSRDDQRVEIPADLIGKTPWQLLPERWRKRLTHFESETRKILNQSSIQFAAKGSALLPVSQAPEIFAELREKRAELCGDPFAEDGPRAGLVDEFIEEWPGILREIRETMTEHARKVMRKRLRREDLDEEGLRQAEELGDQLYGRAISKLPTQDSLRDRFRVVWCIIPLDAGGGTSGVTANWLEARIQELEGLRPHLRGAHGALDEVLGALREQRQTALDESTHRLSALDADDLVSEARTQMRDYVAQSIEDMAAEPRERIASAVDNLLEAIGDENRAVRSGTIGQVERAFNLLEGFRFLADDQLLERMRQCRERMGRVTAQQLNSNREIGSSLANALRPVAEAARNTSRARDMARQFSGIRVRRSRDRPNPASEAPEPAAT